MANVWIWIKNPELLGGRLLSCAYLQLFLSQCWYRLQAASVKVPAWAQHSACRALMFCSQALSRHHQRNIALDVATVFQWWPPCLAGMIFCKSDNCSPASYGCKSKDDFLLGSVTFPYSVLFSWEQHAFQLEKSPSTSALSSWTACVGSTSPAPSILFLSSGSPSNQRLRWPSEHPLLLTESLATFVLRRTRKCHGKLLW